MSNCRHTQLRTGHGTAFGAAELPDGYLRRLLEDPDGLLWQNLDRPVKLDHDSLMVEADLPSIDGPVHVAYKRYRPRNWWKSLCAMFRRGRARRAWQLGHMLHKRQIATARPLVMCQPSRWRSPGAGYLATQWIEGAENLHLAAWGRADDPLHHRLRWAGRCAESLGTLLGRMHAQEIAHRDLKGANLLVSEEAGRVKTYVIDLDGVSLHGRLSARRRVANLARLAASIQAHPWVSRTVHARFLRAYVGQFTATTRHTGEVEWKPLWREVAVQTRRMVARKRRRGKEIL